MDGLGRVRLRRKSGSPKRGERRRRWSSLWTPLIAVVWCCLAGRVLSDVVLPLQSIERWAEIFGQTIYSTAAKATALTDIQTDYLLTQPQVRSLNGSDLILQIKTKLEEMFARKLNALQRLVTVAEKSYANHVYSEDLIVQYPKAKNLNTSEFELVESEHFNKIPVNLTKSTIHVPTNVYDESVAVMNGVAWSEALDAIFQENYKNDPMLRWQYFGSSTGFFRNFPGIRWPKPENDVDLYDCRTRGWYIQAATSPKDMVILLDASGSMKGLRMEIAKATVEKIVETLSDDDFFNVIKFSETPEFLEPCFNGTMVQATVNNKKRIIDTLRKGIKTHNIAYFDKALRDAFELLMSLNGTNQGSQCNKAIMIITDGAPDTYEEIFHHYNWPNKDVRVFTYLIGREVGDPRHIRWMACSNKGYYSHISTLADVHEHVQEYIHVMSRPMVINRANHSVWTNIYRDTSHSDEGIFLTISAAQPVYDTRKQMSASGILLGVMGTDMPLSELIAAIPYHKLGVNGYAFAITNNGYTLFHPDLRPLHDGAAKPNYNSVDLSEVELEMPPNQWNNEFSYKRELLLRNRMVDRETGSVRMTMKIHYDGMKRVSIRDQKYHYAPIEDTPFSVGIAIPEGYGTSWLDGRRALPDSDLSALRSSDIKVASWRFCRPNSEEESSLSPIEFLIKSLERAKTDPDYFSKYCDVELVESLLFDAEATRGVLANWMKENTDGTINDSASKTNGVEIVFVGTKGGLTRFLSLVDNLTEPDFMDSHTDTIKELYYSRAVEGGDGTFTFSVPFLEDKQRADVNKTVVTITTPVVITVNSQDAVAAVTGLQMKYAKFHEFFLTSTSRCFSGSDVKNCNFTCDSDIIDCYLLDENGFVLFSEFPEEHLGRFFGEIDGFVMSKLVKGENDTGVFTKVVVHDYQGMCSIWRKVHCDAQSIFMDPIKNFLSVLFWMLKKITLLLLHFNVFTWCSDEWVTTSGNASDPDDYVEDRFSIQESRDYFQPDWEQLQKISGNNTELFRSWLNEWRRMTHLNEPVHAIQSWYRSILENYQPQVIGVKPCTIASALFTTSFARSAVQQQLPTSGKISKCSSASVCSKSYSVSRVPRTNLILLVLDATCQCENDIKLSLQPVELNPNPEDQESSCPSMVKGERDSCQKFKSDVYRKRLPQCYAYHAQENSTKCGGRSDVHLSSNNCLLYRLLLIVITLSSSSSFSSTFLLLRQ